MGTSMLITGGIRSGKSKFAVELGRKSRGDVVFIATAQAKDKEMKRRILEHRKRRPESWKTFEEPVDILAVLKKLSDFRGFVIVDCLTMWLNNVIEKREEGEIIKELENTVKLCRKLKCRVIFVSNEVGMGIIPDTKIGRRFMETLGKINGIVAENSQEVYLMVSGIPLRIKG